MTKESGSIILVLSYEHRTWAWNSLDYPQYDAETDGIQVTIKKIKPWLLSALLQGTIHGPFLADVPLGKDAFTGRIILNFSWNEHRILIGVNGKPDVEYHMQ